SLGGSEQYVCGEVGGAPVFGPDGTPAAQLGLNLPPVADILRRLAFTSPSGSAVLPLQQTDRVIPGGEGLDSFGVLVMVRQTVRPDARAGHVEVGVSLACFVITPNHDPFSVEGPPKRELLYALFDATVARVKPDPTDPVVEAIRRHETAVVNEL